MGRRDFQSTVADSLPRILQEQAKNGVGSIKFSKKDKKSVGKLYLRGGSIYAIELSTYNPNIVNRIATNEYISEPNRDQLLNKFKDDITNLEAINYVLTYQIFPEKPLMTYIKDYFLDAFDILYTWEEVNAEWRTNDEPPVSIPTVPNASPAELIDKLHKRKAFLTDEVANSWNTRLEEIGNLNFRRNFDDYNDPDYITSVILSLAEGEWTIGGVIEYLGLSNFNTRVIIYDLWKNGLLDIVTPSGTVITNKATDEPETIPVLELPAEETLISTQETPKKASLFTEPKAADSLPVEIIAEVEPEPVLISTPEPVQETEVFFAEAEVIEPEIIIPEQAPVEETVIIEPVLVKEPEIIVAELIPEPEPEPVQVPKSVIAPVSLKNVSPTTQEPQTKDIQMSETGPSTISSRLRLIAEQLKAELKELHSQIEGTRLNKASKESYITSLSAERASLVEKLKTIDSKLSQENRELAETSTELDQLETDYRESIKLTQDLR